MYQTDHLEVHENSMAGLSGEKHFLDYRKSHAREQMIMQCIRDGNLNYTEIAGELILHDSPDNYQTGDPLREAKNAAIIFTAMCRMAAVEGKLSLKAAKEIEIRCIRRIEKSSTIMEISNLRHAMVAEFVSCVHDLAVAPGLSQPIRDCCDYIKNHFMEPLTLSDIAKSVSQTRRLYTF